MKHKYKIGDKVVLTNVSEENTGIPKSILNNIVKNNPHEISGIFYEEDGLCYEIQGFYFKEEQLFLIEKGEDEKMKMRIKYFDGATKMEKIAKGNWIDVYSNADIFVPVGERDMIPLGFALELPQGWEGHLAPRSSTFKTWGIIQTNSVGVVDDTYIGDNDQWHMPVYCLTANCKVNENEIPTVDDRLGVWIRKGDKIGQFRIMEVMPEIEFDEVESFGNADRGGFGTTGVK